MKQVDRIKNTDVLVEAPASKAHTLRALIIGSLAKGRTVIHRPLLAQDQINVVNCLKSLGIEIEQQGDTVVVQGGGGVYYPKTNEIDVGESGVGMNFLTSAANFSYKPVVITGSKRITERPIGEVVKGLRQLGCRMEYLENEGFPPIKISGGGIKGGSAEISGAKSSQYFSSIAISSPYADKNVMLSCIDEMTEKPYFNITLQMMADFGVSAKNEDYQSINILCNQYYKGREVTIEGDYSSASYFFLAAAVCGTKVTVTGLRPDTMQGDKGFLDFLEAMGCDINQNDDEVVLSGNELKAVEIDMSDIPDMVPSAAVACAFAEGTSRLFNIGHLRHKECDRLAVTAGELAKMGVNARCDDDSLIIEGTKNARGAQIDPHNDHRIAMSFAVAGLVTGGQRIENEMCVAKSFPNFWEKFELFSK